MFWPCVLKWIGMWDVLFDRIGLYFYQKGVLKWLGIWDSGLDSSGLNFYQNIYRNVQKLLDHWPISLWQKSISILSKTFERNWLPF